MINIFGKIVFMSKKEFDKEYNSQWEERLETFRVMEALKVENVYLKEFAKDLSKQIRVPSSYCVVCNKSDKCKSFAENSCFKLLENEERLKSLGVEI